MCLWAVHTRGIILATATVNGTILDLDGNPPTSFTITVQVSESVIGTTTNITETAIAAVYNNIDGTWTVDLIYEDVEPVELKWLFNSDTIITNFLTGTNNFNDLTVV